MENLLSILPALEHFGVIGYWLVLLMSLVESLAFVGSLVPGSIFVILAGFLSANGYFDIGDLIWFSAAGAILGDSISYWLGGRGTKLFNDENRILKLSHLNRGEQFFNKYGNKSILLGRLIGPIRSVVPFVAGLFSMNRRIFLFWNVISGFLWATIYLLLGYFFGGAIQAIVSWTTHAGIIIAIGIVASSVAWFFIKRRKENLPRRTLTGV